MAHAWTPWVAAKSCHLHPCQPARRGKVYDRDNSSYLFNLNSDWVLDARQRGNKLRFANHSTNANCRAEILMVRAACRVALDSAFHSYACMYDRPSLPPPLKLQQSHPVFLYFSSLAYIRSQLLSSSNLGELASWRTHR